MVKKTWMRAFHYRLLEKCENSDWSQWSNSRAQLLLRSVNQWGCVKCDHRLGKWSFTLVFLFVMQFLSSDCRTTRQTLTATTNLVPFFWLLVYQTHPRLTLKPCGEIYELLLDFLHTNMFIHQAYMEGFPLWHLCLVACQSGNLTSLHFLTTRWWG